jgi:hypothetical protein
VCSGNQGFDRLSPNGSYLFSVPYSIRNSELTDDEMDWPGYVKAMAALHRLSLDPSREAEVIVQMRHIHTLAQRFLDFPLAADVDPAPTFRP